MPRSDFYFEYVTLFFYETWFLHSTFPLNNIRKIGLATKSFRFFPLDAFSCSKSFFSIANFRPHMVFDSWRFIDYSVKKNFKFCCLFIVLHWFEMEIQDGHFCYILLYYFRKGKNVVQARKNLYNVYGEKLLTERQWQNEFARFYSGDFDLKGAPRSGPPTEVNNDKIKAMIENNWRNTTREIAEKLNI